MHEVAFTLVVICAILIVDFVVVVFIEDRKRKHRRRKRTDVYLAAEDFMETECSIQQDEVAQEGEPTVISVDNVTMKFRITTSSTSGLKDFIIQKIKKQITSRELVALDRISFDVFKGEVVGIIGTNGAGKSTLLKIISGALNPSEGRVIVDRSKIQLLTLGAGFDRQS